MFDAAKRFAGAVGCLVVVAAFACGGTTAPSSGSGGAAGTGGAAADAGGAATAGSGGGGAPPPVVDAAVDSPADVGASPPPSDGDAGTGGGNGRSLPRNVLVFTRSTHAYVHESKLPAATAIKVALGALGVTSIISEDTTLFTAAGLAPFGAIVLVSTTGKPLGDPGTAEQAAMAAFVKGGGGLVSIHGATAVDYGATLPYVQVIGGLFTDHPGGVRNSMCFPNGTHPAAAQLPMSFPILDEIYTFSNRRADSEVIVECLATDGKTRLPIAWHHLEGTGRVFNTALGHSVELWAPDGFLLKQHVLPAILWTLGM